jgi:hypothetical protein
LISIKQEGKYMSSENGKRIRLVNVSRAGAPVAPGDVGTIWRVTPIGTVRVVWDNGSRFALNPKTDQWEVLPDEG